MVGNLVPVLRSDEQLNFAIRPFHDNRITFPVRLRDVLDHEPDSSTVTGKIAFVREPRKAQTTLDMTSAQQQRIITLLEFKLPIPDKTIVISTRGNVEKINKSQIIVLCLRTTSTEILLLSRLKDILSVNSDKHSNLYV